MDDYLDIFDPFARSPWEEEGDAAEETEETPPEKEEPNVKQEATQQAKPPKEEEVTKEQAFPEIEVALGIGYGQFTRDKRAAAVGSFEARQQRERQEAADAYRQKFLGDFTKQLQKTKSGEQAQTLLARRQGDFEEFMAGVDEELQEERTRFMQEVGRRFN